MLALQKLFRNQFYERLIWGVAVIFYFLIASLLLYTALLSQVSLILVQMGSFLYLFTAGIIAVFEYKWSYQNGLVRFVWLIISLIFTMVVGWMMILLAIDTGNQRGLFLVPTVLIIGICALEIFAPQHLVHLPEHSIISVSNNESLRSDLFGYMYFVTHLIHGRITFEKLEVNDEYNLYVDGLGDVPLFLYKVTSRDLDGHLEIYRVLGPAGFPAGNLKVFALGESGCNIIVPTRFALPTHDDYLGDVMMGKLS